MLRKEGSCNKVVLLVVIAWLAKGDVGEINLKICAIKNGNQPINQVQLIVVDLDQGRHYPLNFVCVLPRYFRILEKRSSKFAKLFGERSLHVARKLLVEAFHKEEDPEVRTAINKRIKAIDAKQQPYFK